MEIALIIVNAFLVVCIFALILMLKYAYMSGKRVRINFDEMTGLLNRASFFMQGQSALDKLDKSKHGEVALVVFDVDKLRLINTLYGTADGDDVVCAFAKTLRSLAGKGDVIGRVDTDDFAFLTRLRGRTSEELAEQFAETFPQYIANASVRDQVNYYAGVCIFDGQDDIYTLFNKANLCLLTHADDQRVSEFSGDMEQRMVENEIMRTEMLNALDNGQFELYYQPKVEFKTGKIIGVEALIRWHHPIKGLVPPCDFIPLAEQFGIITKIDEWGLFTACRQGKIWQDKGLPPVKISVNMSQAQFVKTDIYATIVKALDETKLDPQCLEIEVTETMAMTDVEHTVNVLNKVHALGVSISMDDFGTGYSSLASLKAIPFDVLKIDRSLVCDVNDNDTSRRITSAIVAMCKAMKMVVLAEGVETDEQSKLLTDLGCDLAQGYYYSKPRTADEIEVILAADISENAESSAS